MNKSCLEGLSMKTLETVCAYHAGKTAIAICQQCRNSICKIDLNRFEYIRGPKSYDLCFFCYRKKERSEQTQSLIVSIIFLIFLIIIPVLYIESLQVPSPFSSFLILPEVIFGCAFIFIIIYYNSINGKINEATERYSTEPANKNAVASKQKIPNMKNLGTQSFFNQTTPISSNKEPVVAHSGITTTCKSCGNEIAPDDVFCSNCGKSRG